MVRRLFFQLLWVSLRLQLTVILVHPDLRLRLAFRLAASHAPLLSFNRTDHFSFLLRPLHHMVMMTLRLDLLLILSHPFFWRLGTLLILSLISLVRLQTDTLASLALFPPRLIVTPPPFNFLLRVVVPILPDRPWQFLPSDGLNLFPPGAIDSSMVFDHTLANVPHPTLEDAIAELIFVQLQKELNLLVQLLNR